MTSTDLTPLPEDEVLETFERTLADIVPRSADQLELCLLGRGGEYTRFAGNRIHQPQDITETQVLVRAVCDGHASRAATTVLRGVPDAAAAAAEAARGLARGGAVGTTPLAPPTRDDNAAASHLWFDDTTAFDHGVRAAAARVAMDSAQRAGGQAAGMFGRATIQQVVVTSTGVRRAMRATEAAGSLTATVGDGSAHWVDLGRSAERLDMAGAIARTIDQAVAGQHRQSIPPGKYTVVLGPEAVGEILQFLPASGFSGDLAADHVGVCVTRPNAQLASCLVTVADDAGADVGLPTEFDIEGATKQRVVMLDHGRVGQPVTDAATAHRLGAPRSTGHAHIGREQSPSPVAANLMMTPGEDAEDSLIAGVDSGVYIQRFWYTRVVDPNTSTITGVTRDACFRIQHGRMSAPVPGMRFTQSVLGLLNTVDGVGDKLLSQPIMNIWNGVSSAPAVRGHNFALGTPRT